MQSISKKKQVLFVWIQNKATFDSTNNIYLFV